MIEWETGEISREPLTRIAAGDPVTCAIYTKNKKLLEKGVWIIFKGIEKRQQKKFRLANQAKLRSFKLAPKYKYGFQDLRDYNHAIKLNEHNGNTRWQDITSLKMKQLDEYNTFNDMGKDGISSKGSKKIKVNLIYDIKYDTKHKIRCVADGHLTEIPLDNVYSGVISLRGLRIMIFLAELNQPDTWATDIGNAYLEAKTS